MDASFGAHWVGSSKAINAYLQELIEYACSLPTMNTVDAKEVFTAWYEEKFGIFDHSNQMVAQPISTVALHDTEDYEPHSARKALMTAFAEKKVATYFNISWNEFIRQTRHNCNMMIEVADKKQLKDLKEERDRQEKMDKHLQAMREQGQRKP